LKFTFEILFGEYPGTPQTYKKKENRNLVNAYKVFVKEKQGKNFKDYFEITSRNPSRSRRPTKKTKNER
jgi:hypothetical protein